MPNPESISFLRESDYQPVGEGYFTRVVEPSAVTQPDAVVPENIVVKEYQRYPFGGTYIERARLLRERQQAVSTAMSPELPNAVVRSDFVIGETANKQPAVFEIQPRIHGLASVFQEGRLPDVLMSLPPENKQRAIQQLHSLRAALERFTSGDTNTPLHGEVPDILDDNNILLDQNGDIKMIDTNMIHALDKKLPHEYFGERTVLDMYHVQIGRLDTILRSVEK